MFEHSKTYGLLVGNVLALVIFGIISTGAASSPTDSDNDGIPDTSDHCPNTAQLQLVPWDFRYKPTLGAGRLGANPQAWPVDRHGCELDDDKDGVINSNDYCPENTKKELSHGVAKNGCPWHSDMDGTPDYRDRCPGTLANEETDQYGCPRRPQR